MAGIEEFGYRQQLKRALSTRDLLIYGMIVMVPIAPFSIFGFVAQESKGMVALAYLIGMVGMLFTALSYSTMSRAFPMAGSVYTYAQRGLHEAAGFLAGWLILLDYILIPSLLYILSTVALQALWPQVPAWAWMLGFIAFNAFANLRGIEFTAVANRYLLVFELVTLALFLGAGLLALYAGNGAGHLTLHPLYDPKVFSISTVVGATSIAVLSFLGFDSISTLSEESTGGHRAVGRATVGALVLVGLMFMIQTWVAADLGSGMSLGNPDSSFYSISEAAGGFWLKALVLSAVAISSGIANAMGAQAAVSRILFAMARDGQLPAVLARVHERYRTPYASTLLVTALSLVVCLVFVDRVEDLTRLVNFGALCSFLVLHLAVINHHFIRSRSGNWLLHVVSPVIGLVVIAYVLYEMDLTAKKFGLVWLAIGVAYYLVLTRVLRRQVALQV
jgi:amino acid transporter